MYTATRKYEFTPDYAVPPGRTLEEVIETLGMTQKNLALRTGLTEQTIIRIIRGVQPITYETANKLELVTGVPARMWNNLEMQYREQLSKIEQREHLKKGIKWLESIPVKELISREVISGEKDNVVVLQEVLKFYGVSSVEAWRQIWEDPKVAARRSKCFASQPGPTSAWIRLGEIKAGSIETASFNKNSFEKAVREIRGLTCEKASLIQKRMQAICAEAGVALAFVPEFKKVPWNGATKWITPSKALIILNLRGKGEDIFWFSFFHEAAHVLYGKKQNLYIAEDSRNDPEEMKADRFASEILIPSKFNSEISAIRSKKEVVLWAGKLEVSPGIVAGRFRYLTGKWQYFNNLTRTFNWKTAV